MTATDELSPLEKAARAADALIRRAQPIYDWDAGQVARAVLLAVREPSDEVICAGKEEFRYVDWDDLSDAFTTMIDAILEQGQ